MMWFIVCILGSTAYALFSVMFWMGIQNGRGVLYFYEPSTVTAWVEFAVFVILSLLLLVLGVAGFIKRIRSKNNVLPT